MCACLFSRVPCKSRLQSRRPTNRSLERSPRARSVARSLGAGGSVEVPRKMGCLWTMAWMGSSSTTSSSSWQEGKKTTPMARWRYLTHPGHRPVGYGGSWWFVKDGYGILEWFVRAMARYITHQGRARLWLWPLEVMFRLLEWFVLGSFSPTKGAVLVPKAYKTPWVTGAYGPKAPWSGLFGACYITQESPFWCLRPMTYKTLGVSGLLGSLQKQKAGERVGRTEAEHIPGAALLSFLFRDSKIPFRSPHPAKSKPHGACGFRPTPGVLFLPGPSPMSVIPQ